MGSIARLTRAVATGVHASGRLAYWLLCIVIATSPTVVRAELARFLPNVDVLYDTSGFPAVLAIGDGDSCWISQLLECSCELTNLSRIALKENVCIDDPAEAEDYVRSLLGTSIVYRVVDSVSQLKSIVPSRLAARGRDCYSPSAKACVDLGLLAIRRAESPRIVGPYFLVPLIIASFSDTPVPIGWQGSGNCMYGSCYAYSMLMCVLFRVSRRGEICEQLRTEYCEVGCFVQGDPKPADDGAQVGGK